MPPSETLLSVVIVTHNSAAVVGRAIASVFAQDLANEPEGIVVDNGSTDGTAAFIEDNWPKVRVMAAGKNLGFSWANNRGIGMASGKYVMLLNDDAWLEPGCAAALIDALERDEKAGSASPRLYRDAKKTVLDSTGIVLNKRRLRPYDRGEGEPASGRYLEFEEIFGATGACALFKREMIDDVLIDGEFLDEDFFAYYEDVDLAWRAQVIGWKCLYVPAAEAVHERRGPGGKPNAIKKHFLVNRYFCYVKNEPGSLAWRYLPYLIPYELARFARRLFAEPYLIGAVPLLVRLWPRMWYKRRRLLPRRNASSRHLKQSP